ncbi:uncharacterized protein LOC143470285 [Clavelina lepadiformis]|uniref:uncharacterized protein LOC143470285 n=1 Tax=Clavelina lepadiformis TaxID=159417 RepID=UPI0040428CB4
MEGKLLEKLCLRENGFSVTSISTTNFDPQPINEKSHFVQNRIFVGNFPSSATHKDVSNVFRPFGEILQTNIVDKPKFTTRYGFVTFRTIEAADVVLSLYARGRQFVVRGFPVSINRAVFKPRKQLLVNKLLRCPNTGYYKCVMDMGGDKVTAEFVNGTVYFKPFLGANLKKCDYSDLVVCQQKSCGLPVSCGNGLAYKSSLLLPKPSMMPMCCSAFPFANAGNLQMQLPMPQIYSIPNSQMVAPKPMTPVSGVHLPPTHVRSNMMSMPPVVRFAPPQLQVIQ